LYTEKRKRKNILVNFSVKDKSDQLGQVDGSMGDSNLQSPVLLDAFYSSSPNSGQRTSWFSGLNHFVNLLDNYALFIMAGYDTTTCATSWLLYLLAHHPEAKRKLTDEIDHFL